MTVAELIAKLQEMPADAPVQIWQWAGEDWGNELEDVITVVEAQPLWGKGPHVILEAS